MLKISYIKPILILLLLTACGEQKSDEKEVDASVAGIQTDSEILDQQDMETLTDLDVTQAGFQDMD